MEKVNMRVIAGIVVGVLLGLGFEVLIMILYQAMSLFVPALQTGGSWSDLSEYIRLMLSFVGLFWGLVIGITKIAKIKMKTFILGAGRNEKVNLKEEVLPILGLYLLGIALTTLFSVGNISFTGKSLGKILFLIIFSIVFAWMQTSWEELVFRGFALRLVCRDNIGVNRRSFIAAIVTSALFMAAHIANPEVKAMTGVQAVFAVLSYFAAGFGLFFCDMLVGNLLPGLLIHWMNNFFAFVIISAAVSASGASSIWVDNSKASGIVSFMTVMIAYIPVVLYLFLKWKKNRIMRFMNA